MTSHPTTVAGKAMNSAVDLKRQLPEIDRPGWPATERHTKEEPSFVPSPGQCAEREQVKHGIDEDVGDGVPAPKKWKKENPSIRNATGLQKSRKAKRKDSRNDRPHRMSRNEEDLLIDGKGEREGGKGGLSTSMSMAPRLPKRQCALLIGFCGTGCNGMQIQPNVRTIEGLLFDALVKAGAVSQDNSDNPTKVNLGRAARTDAGVHAAGNVVSIKMIMSVPGVPDMVSRINEELPPEIRLWGFVRVQNSFNARLSCDSRKYTYFFPSYLLIPPKPGSGLYRNLQSSANISSPSQPTIPHPFWDLADVASSNKEEDLARKRQWRISPEEICSLREISRLFEGTHNFHNFTVGRDFCDRSNQRHMKKIEVSDPVVHGDTEWISVTLHGQSFMLHQRKMMFILILSCRTSTPTQIVDQLYGPKTVFIPKMPSMGLLLEQPVFDSYNNKVATINDKLEPSEPNYRPAIDFDLYRESIEKFKQQHIYTQMRAIEDREAIFDAWIRSVDNYAGNDLLYLNTKGVIPTEAVITNGQRREKPFREKRRFEAAGFAGNLVSKVEDEEEVDEVLRESLAETEG